MRWELFLEILNGGTVTPDLLWMVLLGHYLSRESKRRGLHALDWFHLPPSMNLVLAVFICDLGVWIRSATLWSWRYLGAGDFTDVESALMILGGALIVLGYLCKIRALTEPDHGNMPWAVAAASTGGAIILLLLLHRL